MIKLTPLVFLIHLLHADNECLNGKSPKALNKKEMLKEFAKGPCSPFILIPGVLSTKLIVEIDCPVLKNENFEIFSACGWTDCTKTKMEFWKSVPKSEYQMWIPSYTSPMDIFSFSVKSSQCWAKLIHQNIDFTKKIEEAVQPIKGIKINVYGSTPETHKNFQCGDESISNILDAYLQIPATRTFGPLINTLRRMGYVAGLTYQSMPYNFNKPLQSNEMSHAFGDNLERLNTLTNKKVTIISHSFGGLITHYQLNKLDSSYKQKVVKQWIAMATPFLGGTKAFKLTLSGSDNLMYMHNYFGLEFKAAIEGFSANIGTFQLLSRDPYTVLKDEEWFKSIQKRTLYEEGLIPYELTDLKFLPPKEAFCSPANYISVPQSCVLGLYDTSKNFTVKVGEDEFMMTEADKLFEKYNIVKTASELFKLTYNDEMFKLINPGVPMISINLRTADTTKQLIYDADLMEYIERDIYPKPKVIYGYGDKTVDAYSQFIPLLKWAKEFEDKKEGAMPLKIIDFCSIYNEKYNPFDGTNAQGENIICQNDFFGISCSCINSQNPLKCNHGLMVQDNSIFELIKVSLQTNEISFDFQYDMFVDSLEDEYLDKISIECPQVVY